MLVRLLNRKCGYPFLVVVFPAHVSVCLANLGFDDSRFLT